MKVHSSCFTYLNTVVCLTSLLRKSPFFLAVYVDPTAAVSDSVQYYSNDSQNFNVTPRSSQKHFVLLVYSINLDQDRDRWRALVRRVL